MGSPIPWSVSVTLLFNFLMKRDKVFTEASQAGFLLIPWSVERDKLVTQPEDVQNSLSHAPLFSSSLDMNLMSGSQSVVPEAAGSASLGN